jgi:hypothetical protein
VFDYIADWTPSLPAISDRLFIALVAGAFTILGVLITVGSNWYWNRASVRKELRPIAIRLAALAIRARQEVIDQFVTVDPEYLKDLKAHSIVKLMEREPWIPSALKRLEYLLNDLESLMSDLKADTAEIHVLLWSARDALESHMSVLSSWQLGGKPSISVEHIGPEMPSHLDIFSVAEMLSRAHERIPYDSIRKESGRLAQSISQLRRRMEKRVHPTIQQLQKLDESRRQIWVDTGRLPRMPKT